MPFKYSRIFSLLPILFIACEELDIDLDNPFEADPSEQIPDIISLVQSVNGSTASFNWEGNKFAFFYSFRLEALSYEDPAGMYINWSDWSSDTLVTLEDLDEGQYIFQVKSRFDEIEQSEPTTINFEVDAIPGPALRIYPLNQIVNTGYEFDVYLYIEEVPEELAVTGLDIDIQINTDELEFLSCANTDKVLNNIKTNITIFLISLILIMFGNL